jgi:hypothetical protein
MQGVYGRVYASSYLQNVGLHGRRAEQIEELGKVSVSSRGRSTSVLPLPSAQGTASEVEVYMN